MKKIGEFVWGIIEAIAIWCLRLLFKIIHKELTKDAEEAFIQFVKFGIVGLSNTIISYILYSGSLLIFKKLGLLDNEMPILGKLDYLMAQVIAFVLSVAWSFYWNNKYVFKVQEGKHRKILPALLKTYVSYSFTGLFLNTFLLILWVQVLGVNEFVAPIINLLISVPLNFIINKLWAFKTN